MAILNRFNLLSSTISIKFSEYAYSISFIFRVCNFWTGFVPHTKRALVDESSVVCNSCFCLVRAAPRHRDGVRGQVSNSAIDRIPVLRLAPRAQDEMQIATRLRIGESPRDPPRHGSSWRENTLAVSGEFGPDALNLHRGT